MLNNIQRCSAKILQLHEEKSCCDLDTDLKLFSAFIYFSSPTQRNKFRSDIEKFLDKCESLETLLLLKKLMSYVKISDTKLCDQYWSMCLKCIQTTNDWGVIVSLCKNYINFNTDVSNFHHYQFEKRMFQCIKEILNNNEIIYPSEMMTFLSFAMQYNGNEKLLNTLIEKLENNLNHLKPIHYLHLVEALGSKSNSIPKHVRARTNDLLNRLKHLLLKSENNFFQNYLLAKAMVQSGHNLDNDVFETLMYKFKEIDNITSKMIESLCNIFFVSNSIIPEVLNKCTEYIVHYPENIVGFNAEKLLYLCYFLGYYPLNADKFLMVVTNIIFR